MMNPQELITSGMLELYVSGNLPEADMIELTKQIKENTSLLAEVEALESKYKLLAEGVSPIVSANVWDTIKKRTKTSTPLVSKLGWAAAVLCMIGLLWTIKQNNDLNNSLNKEITTNVILKETNQNIATQLASAEEKLNIVQSPLYKKYVLPGNQAVSPDAYANVFVDPETKTAYIDISGLPSPPEGKAYQAWSLELDPLTPTSLGVMSNKVTASTQFFKFENLPKTEAIGITLEDEAGVESPTLSQLYTLGEVSVMP